MVQYDMVSAYAVGEGKKAIIFIHDMFGLNSGMNKLICDTLSDRLKDTVVIAPDFFIFGNVFGNDPLKERGVWLLPKMIWMICCCKAINFFQKYSWDNVAGSVFDKTTSYLLSKGVDKFIPLGFCYGAYVGFRACGSALHRENIIANMSCHPSVGGVAWLTSEKEQDIIDAVNCPQMVASTPQEPIDWHPNGKTQTFFDQKSFGSQCEYYHYKEVHGFMTRGDTTVRATRDAVGDCLNKIVAFVNKFST